MHKKKLEPYVFLILRCRLRRRSSTGGGGGGKGAVAPAVRPVAARANGSFLTLPPVQPEHPLHTRTRSRPVSSEFCFVAGQSFCHLQMFRQRGTQEQDTLLRIRNFYGQHASPDHHESVATPTPLPLPFPKPQSQPQFFKITGLESFFHKPYLKKNSTDSPRPPTAATARGRPLPTPPSAPPAANCNRPTPPDRDPSNSWAANQPNSPSIPTRPTRE